MGYSNFDDFDKFFHLCFCMPIELSNPKVSTNDDQFITYTEVEFGDASKCEVRISYVSGVDYEGIREEYFKDFDEKDLEFLKNRFDSDEYEMMIEKIKKDRKLGEELMQTKFPSDCKCYVVTPDLTITADDKQFQSTIMLQDGGLIVLYGLFDDNNHIESISASLFSSMLDFAEDGFFESQVNCDSIRERETKLKNEGVLPEVKLDIDFEELLINNGLIYMYDYSISALYYAKDSIVNKINEQRNNKIR